VIDLLDFVDFKEILRNFRRLVNCSHITCWWGGSVFDVSAFACLFLNVNRINLYTRIRMYDPVTRVKERPWQYHF